MIKNLKNNFRNKLDHVMRDKRLGGMLTSCSKKILASIMSEVDGNVKIKMKDANH
jgi:hypothetical protein